MSGWKRAPSSLVKNATASGRGGVRPACMRVSITSMPARTPRLPSNRPPVRTVSMCEPVITGRPAPTCQVPTTLPTASTTTSRPRSRIHVTTRSRPSRSASVRARRHEPPPSMGPTRANSSRRANRRAPDTRTPPSDVTARVYILSKTTRRPWRGHSGGVVVR